MLLSVPLASAGVGDIRSAIWAMKTPAPAIAAANIRTVRITPLTRGQKTADLTTPSAKPRLTRGTGDRHFDEKDEGRVNELPSSAARLDTARRQRGGRIFRPGVFWISASQFSSDLRIGTFPKALQIRGGLYGPAIGC